MSSIPAICQDKIQVYFEIGSSKIADSQLKTLNALASDYDLSEVDSVTFTGYADSTGKIRSNLRLGEKRAKNVFRYCAAALPEKTPVSIYSKGEKNKNIENKDRRVEIVIFYHFSPVPITDEVKPDTIKPAKKCFYQDCGLLFCCNARPVLKGKKNYILLERGFFEIYPPGRIFYYGSKNSGGEIVTKKVVWTPKITGNLWWKKQRYTTMIPKQDFEDFGIFYIESAPCDSCNINSDKRVLKDTSFREDVFIKDNHQVQRIFRNKKSIIMRVPAEYVDTSLTYYSGRYDRKIVKWESKRGRKNQHYYFTRLPAQYFRNSWRHIYFDYSYPEIYRENLCCNRPQKPGVPYIRPPLRLSWLHYLYKHFIIEIGNNYQQHHHKQYIGLGIFNDGKYDQFTAIAGIDRKTKFYAAARYQYNYFTFPLGSLNPFPAFGERNYSNRLGRFYAGTELKKGRDEKHFSFIETNLHLGFSAVNYYSPFYRIYLQYGYGYDFNRNNSKYVYPVIQAGLIIKLYFIVGSSRS